MTLYKTRLLAEWLVLFIGVPLALALDLVDLPGRFGKLWVLVAATLACFLYLWWDKSFDTRRLGGLAKIKLIWKSLLLRCLLCAVLLLGAVLIFFPNSIFGLLRYNYKIWIIVFVFYPFLSAWPQELIYRSFMFQRYKSLFGQNFGMVAASSVAFAFLHIIYLNWIALASTLVAGYIFSINYKKTGYLAPAFVEHAVYGNLLFTIGLGMFFFRAI